LAFNINPNEASTKYKYCTNIDLTMSADFCLLTELAYQCEIVFVIFFPDTIRRRVRESRLLASARLFTEASMSKPAGKSKHRLKRHITPTISNNGTTALLLNSTQQDIMDVGADTSYIRIYISNLIKTL